MLFRRRFVQAAAAGANAAVAQDRPNIVFIMADEHRYAAMRYAGNTIVRTPQRRQLLCDGGQNKLPWELFDLEKDRDEMRNLVNEPG